jgi:purine-cytosine permease-like protein
MIGLVIPPFFSVWILGYLLYPKSNLEQRKSELLFQGSLKLFQLKYEFYIAGFLLCLLCVVLFFPIIMLVPPDSECIFETYQSFLSKFVLCWIVFTMFLPFFLQRRAMKNMYSQFQTASSEAIEVIEHQYQKSLPKLD